ncbi:MAG: glycoside hydrolase family 2 TIM barrel-domain containing protein [Cytophagaceae bacterium]
MRIVLIFILILLTLPGFSKTTVKKEGNGWKLYVDEKAFDVRGVTFHGDWNKKTIGQYLKELQFLGVNTIRTWGTNDETKVLLDSAHAYGIKVMVGIWLRHGRPGMEGDDSFNYLQDKKGMDDMYKGAIETVNKYKNHPAVLWWGVGNEVILNIATDQEKKEYSQFLEKVCSEIKRIDADHPVASVDAWNFAFKWWKEYAPSIDVYGVNVYGGGSNQIPDELSKLGIDKPYVITEYGVSGEWDAKEDKNGVRTEPGDREKYDVIAKGYKDWIKSKPNCLGVYVFHYESGKNFGAVWLLMKYDGAYRPAYWATREAFTGKKPVNNVPEINSFTVQDTALPAGSWIPVKLSVSDKENDELDISFHYNQRTGGRARRDQINKLEFRGNLKDGYEIKLPEENGGIKVYVFVKDSYNNIGIAHSSILIRNPKSDNLIPGAKVDLPFYVYKDDKNLPYIPTAYMGDIKYLKVDMNFRESVHSGMSAIKITYDHTGGWFGLGLVDPPDDWGDRPGGYNLTGAKKMTFWAKASSDEVVGTFGFGLIGKDKPYYDTDKKSSKIFLTTQWKKYEIDISKADLRCIRSGFTIYSGGIGQSFSIYIDDIMFE